ncbi:copper chaperone PCu(A)C [Streptosporangium sp. NPDC051022]|uniref:copper chaperone PCu(A)C n=1 Tax=Streptosporangium sp. NPDC051022 TaxID=3155752 RepID=UPI0034488025
MIVRRALSTGLLAALAAVSASACGAQSTEQPADQQAAPAAATTAAQQAAPNAPAEGPPLAITDPWVKSTKKKMTAAFGTLVNNTDVDMTVVSGSSPLSRKIELHEVVDSGGKAVMRQKKGGFVIPARGTLQLQPGGDHLMLMGVKKEVKPGAQIGLTLTLQGGETLEFTAVGKDFAGGEEHYRPGGGTDTDTETETGADTGTETGTDTGADTETGTETGTGTDSD